MEIGVLIFLAPEAVDQQANLHAAFARRDQRLLDARRHLVIGEDIEINAER